MKQYNTRIQLKCDTKTKWDTIESSFKPLAGEIIIYLPDNHSSLYRLKVGDGDNTLNNLPFIDAGTLNGKQVEIVKLTSFNERPQIGSPDKIYIDISTSTIYHYDAIAGYKQLSNFTVSTTTTAVSKITNWSAGTMTNATIEGHTLRIINGQIPSLTYTNLLVIDTLGTV